MLFYGIKNRWGALRKNEDLQNDQYLTLKDPCGSNKAGKRCSTGGRVGSGMSGAGAGAMPSLHAQDNSNVTDGLLATDTRFVSQLAENASSRFAARE